MTRTFTPAELWAGGLAGPHQPVKHLHHETNTSIWYWSVSDRGAGALIAYCVSQREALAEMPAKLSVMGKRGDERRTVVLYGDPTLCDQWAEGHYFDQPTFR